MANLGLSFLSRTLVRQEVAGGQLVEVPLDGLECKHSQEWLHKKI